MGSYGSPTLVAHDWASEAVLGRAIGKAIMNEVDTSLTRLNMDYIDLYQKVRYIRVGEIASARNTPRAQVALAYIFKKSNITAAITAATKPQHVDDAVGALDVRLNDEEVGKLEAPHAPHSVAGFA